MILARIAGSATATVKHPSMAGMRLLICEPLDAKHQPGGKLFVAADYSGAAVGQEVMVTTDGLAAERYHKSAKCPVRNVVLGQVDEIVREEPA